MNTKFKAGTLYKLSPKHYSYWSGINRIFLCTAKMYPAILDTEGRVHYNFQKVHLLIDVDTGELWDTNPNKQEYEEYLQ